MRYLIGQRRNAIGWSCDLNGAIKGDDRNELMEKGFGK
jgi:hypothetical protein